MSRKLAYISTFFALAVFFFSSGIITHGQNDGGVYDQATGSRQKMTDYVKSEEQTTGVEDSEVGAVKDDAGSQQNALTEGKADQKASPSPEVSMDANYKTETPKDYFVNMPPPTPKEAAENIAKAVKVDNIVSAGKAPSSKGTGLKLLAASYHYLGLPYRLGGNGVTSTDCSMFTRMSAIRAKLEPESYQRGAGIQYGYSLKKKFDMVMVSKGSTLKYLQPGDFLFFNWRNNFSRVRPYGIGHVALYIGPTKGSSVYTIEAGDPVHKGWRSTKYLVGVGRIVKK